MSWWPLTSAREAGLYFSTQGRLSSASTGRFAAPRLPLFSVAAEEKVMSVFLEGASSMGTSESSASDIVTVVMRWWWSEGQWETRFNEGRVKWATLTLHSAPLQSNPQSSAKGSDIELTSPFTKVTTATMPAYHSVFLDEPNQHLVGNFALLPLRTKTRGPAQQLPQLPPGTSDLDLDPSAENYDPLDEILSLFRANTFFRNFEIKGPADRVLIYGILYLTDILSKIKPGMARRDAEKAVMNVALETNFAIPGDAGFPLNQMFEPPKDRNEAEVLRQYAMQMRQELAQRLLSRVYADGTGVPSKVSLDRRWRLSGDVVLTSF